MPWDLFMVRLTFALLLAFTWLLPTLGARAQDPLAARLLPLIGRMKVRWRSPCGISRKTLPSTFALTCRCLDRQLD